MAHLLDLLFGGSLALSSLALSLAIALALAWELAHLTGERAGARVAGAAGAAPIASPRRVGPYTLVDKLGEGAMGEVYRAWNAASGDWRAVKLLPRGASVRDRERFAKEARLGAELCNRNTVAIFDSGEARDGTCYYAMELLDGVTLRELVEREGRQPPERVVRILLQLCAALDEAHQKGVVHRDIKPENVVLSSDGQCKLIDFGLAERLGELGQAGEDGAVVGTPLYISPEAIAAPATVDARSDLYGLGAVAYFLLRGAPVFQGSSVIEVCGHHLHTPPEPLSTTLGVPAALEHIVMDCLAKDAEQRPASAAELGLRLRACELWGPTPATVVAPGVPRCLAQARAQRAFERLDAALAATARAA